jgi:hypothetical protein
MQDAGSKEIAAPSLAAASHAHACGALERAADPLHRARINTKPSSDLAHALCAPRLAQSRTDAGFQLGGYLWPAEPLAFALGPRKPRADSFLDDRAIIWNLVI